ncbi:hypothetical protein J2T41_003285 [Pseudomonas citronellolis]|nr:hypothetical protein [Pseudomonas citronellolis]MCP1704121.1 hypothetical protein [Pseudomonas citronellolis]
MDNGLILDSTEDKEKEVGVHVRSFIARLKGKECKFEEFSNLSGCTVQIACSIYYDEEPPLLLDKDLISWVGSIGGSIDIDIYHVERAVELGTES